MRRVSLALLAVLVLGVAGPTGVASAESPPASASEERARQAIWVIPPGREDEAAALMAELRAATPAGVSWIGPTIEVDRIKWWLSAGDEARAILVLVPAELGSEDAPRSESFAIEVEWAPGVSPSAAERELIADAIAAIQARDEGGFYNVAVDNALQIGGVVIDIRNEADQAALEPAEVRQRWIRRLVGIGLLSLLALAVALRGLFAGPRELAS